MRCSRAHCARRQRIGLTRSNGVVGQVGGVPADGEGVVGSPESPFPDDPALRAAAARLRHEWRLDEEETARDAFAAWRHTRTLEQVLRESMARGDRVEVRVHGHELRGVIVDLAHDLLSLREAPGRPRVDLRHGADVPLAVRVLVPAVAQGRVGGGEDGDFRGRLLGREESEEPCRVYLVGEPEPLVGRIVVGDDVVDVIADDGTTWCVRQAAIVALTTARDDAASRA